MLDIYTGQLVRLATETPEVFARTFARWEQDSEYNRLADSEPVILWSEKLRKTRIEKRMDDDPMRSFRFSIRTLAEDKLIGEVSINPVWPSGDAWTGIVIGEREYWGRGYGTDAMRLVVQYGFMELGLQRISLSLFAYNERARKSYEKVGFRVEGIMRRDSLREGHRSDSVFMGILRRDWLSLQGARP